MWRTNGRMFHRSFLGRFLYRYGYVQCVVHIPCTIGIEKISSLFFMVQPNFFFPFRMDGAQDRTSFRDHSVFKSSFFCHWLGHQLKNDFRYFAFGLFPLPILWFLVSDFGWVQCFLTDEKDGPPAPLISSNIGWNAGRRRWRDSRDWKWSPRMTRNWTLWITFLSYRSNKEDFVAFCATRRMWRRSHKLFIAPTK